MSAEPIPKKRRISRPKKLTEWTCAEHKEKIEALGLQIHETGKAVSAMMPSCMKMGYIGQAIRDTNLACNAQVKAAAEAHLRMREFVSELVNDHNMDCQFVVTALRNVIRELAGLGPFRPRSPRINASAVSNKLK